MNILITGATGLIGKEIGKVLAEKGHKIFVISRDQKKARAVLPFPCEVIEGDLSLGAIQDERLKKVDVVMNLLGESVMSGRWSRERKKKIYNSRVLGTRHLVASLPTTVKVFVSGSAIGFYGNRGDQLIGEDEILGSDFLANVCRDWESEALKAPGRVVLIRTGIVLAQEGGALTEMLFPFRAGVGGILGNGKHWMSWIHLQDIVGLFIFSLENEKVKGALNGTAPRPERNKEFTKFLAAAVGRHVGPPIPQIALKILFGEAAGVVLSSIQCSSSKAQQLGYKFKFEMLSDALADLCAPYLSGEDLFYAEQFIPGAPEKVFEFFKDPFNLEKITPQLLSFRIEKVSDRVIQQGTLIDYQLKIHGVPAKWKTKIDEWQPPLKFVDTQLKGPYRLWHHTHEFRPFCGGTLMTDRVRFKLPVGYLGWLFGSYLVRKDVENIFSFRRKVILGLRFD